MEAEVELQRKSKILQTRMAIGAESFFSLLSIICLVGCAGKNTTIKSTAGASVTTTEASTRPAVLRTLSGSLSLQMNDSLVCVVPATSADETRVKTEGLDPALEAKKVTTKFFFYSNRSGNIPRATVAGLMGQASGIYQLRAPEDVGVTSRRDMTPSQMAIADQVDDTFSCKIQYSIDGNLVSSPLSEGFKLTVTPPENICVGKTVGGVAGTSLCQSVAPAASSICAGTTIVGATGTAICQSGTGTGSDPVAGEILDGKSTWKSDGTVLNGTMANRGTLDLATSFPGSGYYSSLSGAPANTGLCTGTTIFGITGSALCLSASGGTNASASDVLIGSYFWNSAGTSTQGSMANRATWNMTTTFPGAGYFAAVSNAPAASTICAGTTVAGTPGSANCGGFAGNIGSGIHRDAGGSPSQLTLAGELSAANTLPNGYRVIPDTSIDDEGWSALPAIRGTSVWNGAVPRVVCGMGIATIAGRITDCATRHVTKPGWDAGVEGKISWDGTVKGNVSDGVWTLVSVYDASRSNGITCAASCKEVWRDDRTGLIWSDVLGDLSTNSNSGKFNWCLASGNTQDNSNGIECRANSVNSYNNHNNLGISLCAEAAGLTTPVGVHNVATDNDNSTWSNSGTSIRDSKAGMLQTVNSDPAGLSQSPSVRWRLPSRNDYLQAEIDGMLKVLPHIGIGGAWAATVSVSDRSYAYRVFDHAGYTTFLRSSAGFVRCVGR